MRAKVVSLSSSLTARYKIKCLEVLDMLLPCRIEMDKNILVLFYQINKVTLIITFHKTVKLKLCYIQVIKYCAVSSDEQT